MRRSQRGQAITEYALLGALLVGAFFVPFFPGPNGGFVSVFELSISVIDIYIAGFHSAIMLPVP
ncbi:MAG: hypothetical protein ACAI38_03105 [Myxococcota bacterium]|nr:hypothetical protein [Myxococcota bacterium]